MLSQEPWQLDRDGVGMLIIKGHERTC